jgi:hypothetical protein
MKITAKFITNFTAAKAEALIKASVKLDRRWSYLVDKGLDYSKTAIAVDAKIVAMDAKWQAIADMINEDHSQYDEICFTGFLDG